MRRTTARLPPTPLLFLRNACQSDKSLPCQTKSPEAAINMRKGVHFSFCCGEADDPQAEACLHI